MIFVLLLLILILVFHLQTNLKLFGILNLLLGKGNTLQQFQTASLVVWSYKWALFSRFVTYWSFDIALFWVHFEPFWAPFFGGCCMVWKMSANGVELFYNNLATFILKWLFEIFLEPFWAKSDHFRDWGKVQKMFTV